jgi:hypothetical protein
MKHNSLNLAYFSDKCLHFLFLFFRIVFVPEENLAGIEESSEDDPSDESASESLKLSEIHGDICAEDMFE